MLFVSDAIHSEEEQQNQRNNNKEKVTRKRKEKNPFNFIIIYTKIGLTMIQKQNCFKH